MKSKMLPGLYDDCKTTLKETSLDSQKGSENKYVSESSLIVYNFDEEIKSKKIHSVRDKYCNDIHQLKLSEKMNACDAFYVDEQGNNERYLIEFKNSLLENIAGKHTTIKEKMLGSLLLLTDITETNISSIREDTSFILVYSDAKNRIKSGLRPSGSSMPKKLNFEKYEKIFYKKCLILGSDVFQKQFVNIWEQKGGATA